MHEGFIRNPFRSERPAVGVAGPVPAGISRPFPWERIPHESLVVRLPDDTDLHSGHRCTRGSSETRSAPNGPRSVSPDRCRRVSHGRSRGNGFLMSPSWSDSQTTLMCILGADPRGVHAKPVPLGTVRDP